MSSKKSAFAKFFRLFAKMTVSQGVNQEWSGARRGRVARGSGSGARRGVRPLPCAHSAVRLCGRGSGGARIGSGARGSGSGARRGVRPLPITCTAVGGAGGAVGARA